MGFNVPDGSVGNVTFGQGILKIGPVGATPTTDVGFCKDGASLQYTRTPLDLKQGMPQRLIKRWIVDEMAVLSVQGLEITIDQLKKAFGNGRQSGQNLGVGGSMNSDEWAVMYQHVTQAGHTFYIDIFRASREGDFNMSFGNEFHEIPLSFMAMNTTTNWAGQTLQDDEQLFRIRKIAAP